MILVDTNVLLDVVMDDPAWADWSQQQLNAATLRDRLAVNLVVYAELSSRFAQIEDLDATLASVDIVVAEMPRTALFLAGQVFKPIAVVAACGIVCCWTSSSARMRPCSARH